MKFFIALVLALAMCSFASAQGFDGGWIETPYDPNNATLSDFYEFGREMAQLRAIETGEDPNGDWIYLEVNRLDVLGVYYRFNVAIVQGTIGPATLVFTISNPPLQFVSWAIN